MKMFTDKPGVPTIVVVSIVILLSVISLPRTYNKFLRAGGGHSYVELRKSGTPHEQARSRAMQDGMQSGILMVLGQHVPFTMLVLITIGLISKSTAIQFKRTLRILYLIVAGAGVIFLSLGASYWGEAIPFPASLSPSFLIYLAISAILWSIIGISGFVRGRQKTERATEIN